MVHCAAGKDRTGVVCALALAVAGVGHDDIVADYAMTADVIDALVAKLAASPTYAEDMVSRDVASHTPRAETMDRVLTLLDERYGGPAGWLEAHGFGAGRAGVARAPACATESQRVERVERWPCLCRYIAASASRSSCSAVPSEPTGWTATPTLVPTATSVPSSRKGSSKQPATRSARLARILGRRPGRAG